MRLTWRSGFPQVEAFIVGQTQEQVSAAIAGGIYTFTAGSVQRHDDVKVSQAPTRRVRNLVMERGKEKGSAKKKGQRERRNTEL